MAKRRVVLTGAAGYISSQLLPVFRERYDLVLLDLTKEGKQGPFEDIQLQWQGGLFSRPAIAVGYVLHGLWDLSHSLSGSSLAGLSLTDIPLGYGIFCLTYDFTVACYLMRSDTAWHEPGKFDLYFWRHRA